MKRTLSLSASLFVLVVAARASAQLVPQGAPLVPPASQLPQSGTPPPPADVMTPGRFSVQPQPYPQQPYPPYPPAGRAQPAPAPRYSQPYPYPPQPYPYPQQYPQQQYPQQQYPQQQYPAQQYPPQQYPPPQSPPPSSPSSSSSSSSQSSGPAGYAVSGVLGFMMSRAVVDQGPEWRTVAGGLFLHGLATGFVGYGAGRGRVSAFVGGGGGGAEGMYAAEIYVGGGLPISDSSQITLRIGIDAVGLKNDEIEADTGELPGFQLGWQIWTNGIGLEVGGKGGVVPRTEYEPGDEMQGRRYWRRFNTELDYGAYGSLVSEFFTVSGSYRRIPHDEVVTVWEGNACLHLIAALCAVGQQWKGAAFGPTGGGIGPGQAQGEQVITSTYLGLSLGLGASTTKAGRISERLGTKW